MTSFVPGDRVRVASTGDDGYPLVRYGFVGRPCVDGIVEVLLDDELPGTALVDLSQLEPVTITTVELRLDGIDLLVDPALRPGLVNLWHAEAEQAGLEIDALHHTGGGLRDAGDGYVLAELTAGGEHYVLRAECDPYDSDTVRVRVERPNRWDW